MTTTLPPTPPPAPTIEGAHLLLYDGVCGLCNRLLQFVLARDRRGVFVFAALQSELGRDVVRRADGDPDDLTTMYVVANYRTPGARVLQRSRAALFVLGQLGWPWQAASAIGVLPTAILDPMYGLVSRVRYRLFGRLEQCLLPSPQHRKRFIG